MTLYETLGVQPDATPAAIKSAYRSLAQKNHPDKGGDKETFQRIQEAYAVLSDEAKRAQYDQTGEVPGHVPTARENAMQIISQVLDKILDQIDPDYSNLVGEIDKNVKSALAEIDSRKKGIVQRLKRVETALARTKVMDGKEDAFGPVLEHFKQKHAGELAHMDRQHVIFTEALGIVREHTYTVDSAAKPSADNVFNERINTAFMRQMFGARGGL